MQLDANEAAVYSEEAGCFLDSKFLRLAEVIADYDPYLEVRWIPPALRSEGERSKPYCIVHSPPGQPQYVVMFFNDLDQPEAILGKLIAGDNWNGNVLAQMEATNTAQELLQLKKHMDELEESADMFHFLWTNRSKNYVKWKDRDTGELVKLDSTRRRV